MVVITGFSNIFIQSIPKEYESDIYPHEDYDEKINDYLDNPMLEPPFTQVITPEAEEWRNSNENILLCDFYRSITYHKNSDSYNFSFTYNDYENILLRNSSVPLPTKNNTMFIISGNDNIREFKSKVDEYIFDVLDTSFVASLKMVINLALQNGIIVFDF